MKLTGKSNAKGRKKKKKRSGDSSSEAESDTDAESSAAEGASPIRATAPPSGLLTGQGATIIEDEGERSLHVTFHEPDGPISRVRALLS